MSLGPTVMPCLHCSFMLFLIAPVSDGCPVLTISASGGGSVMPCFRQRVRALEPPLLPLAIQPARVFCLQRMTTYGPKSGLG